MVCRDPVLEQRGKVLVARRVPASRRLGPRRAEARGGGAGEGDLVLFCQGLRGLEAAFAGVTEDEDAGDMKW